MGEQIDADSKSEIEAAIKEVKDVLSSDDVAAIKAKSEALQQAFHKVSEQIYQAAQQQAASAPGDGAGADGAGDEEEVVDAEVVDDERSS
jgi:molecular chaperone DnaK